MKVLIDTHALIWFAESSSRLSKTAIRLLQDDTHTIYYSVVSMWEMTIKHQLGKLHLNAPLDADFRRKAFENGMFEVPIEFKHVIHTGKLPLHHRDPFDRLLVAQAVVEGFSIVSQDEMLDAYPVNRIW